jgi:hypothetical protein
MALVGGRIRLSEKIAEIYNDMGWILTQRFVA